MFIILLLFSCVCVYNMKFSKAKQFNDGYISKENSTAVKGIFVFLVFMSHFTQYYEMTTAFDEPYKEIKNYLGQLVVTMFLFYSGYGIFESVKKRGSGYIMSFPKNRFLKVLLHLDIAIVIFLIFDLITGYEVKPLQVLLSLIGWDSIGNSNWFMFTVLALYVVIYLAFLVCRKNNALAITLTTIITVIYIVIMIKYKDAYWYNTALCLPAGMWYSFFKEKIEKFVMKNNTRYILSALVCFAIFAVSSKLSENSLIAYEIWSIAFSLLIVLLTMKVNFGNKVLMWLGNHVFSVYMLQRLPMIALGNFDIITSNPYHYFLLSLIITVIISELFDRLTGIIDKNLFSKNKKIVHVNP